MDPALRNILEQTILENDNSLHLDNACGIPMLLRVGTEDKGVHPWFTRRMLRQAGEVCG